MSNKLNEKLELFLKDHKSVVAEYFSLKNAAILEENIGLEGKWFKTSERISSFIFIFVIKVRKCATIAFTLDVTEKSIEYNERECSELKRFEHATLSEIDDTLSNLEKRVEMVKRLDVAKMKSDLKVP